MSTEILMPKLGFAMEEGDLIEWLVGDGDSVAEGAPLFVLESEKSSQEVESPVAGTVRILVSEVGTYPVGTQLAVIEQ